MFKIFVLLALFLPVVYIIGRVAFARKIERFLFVFVPSLYVSIFAIDSVVAVLPEFPDSEGYRLALEKNISNIDIGGVYVDFYYLNTPIRVLGGVPLFIVTGCILFTVGSALIWRAWMRISESSNDQSGMTFLLLLAVWPAALLYIPALLRESQTIFFWGVSIYSVTVLSKFPRWVGGWIFASFGSFGLFYLREELLLAVFAFALIYNTLSISQVKKERVLLTAAAAIFGKVMVDLYGYSRLLNPRRLEYLRKVRVSPNTRSYMGSVDWGSWLDVFLDSLVLVTYLFTSPLLNSSDQFEMLIATLDGIFVIFVLVCVFLGCWNACRYRYMDEIRWVVTIALIGVGVSLIEFHVTGAVRHRIPLILCLLPVASTAITKYLRNRFKVVF